MGFNALHVLSALAIAETASMRLGAADGDRALGLADHGELLDPGRMAGNAGYP